MVAVWGIRFSPLVGCLRDTFAAKWLLCRKTVLQSSLAAHREELTSQSDIGIAVEFQASNDCYVVLFYGSSKASLTKTHCIKIAPFRCLHKMLSHFRQMMRYTFMPSVLIQWTQKWSQSVQGRVRLQSHHRRINILAELQLANPRHLHRQAGRPTACSWQRLAFILFDVNILRAFYPNWQRG